MEGFPRADNLNKPRQKSESIEIDAAVGALLNIVRDMSMDINDSEGRLQFKDVIAPQLEAFMHAHGGEAARASLLAALSQTHPTPETPLWVLQKMLTGSPRTAAPAHVTS